MASLKHFILKASVFPTNRSYISYFPLNPLKRRYCSGIICGTQLKRPLICDGFRDLGPSFRPHKGPNDWIRFCRRVAIDAIRNQSSHRLEDEKIYRDIPLPHEDSIRILEIKPGSQDDPLICSLNTGRLSNHLSFEALSYAWGSPHEKGESIECNGQAVEVRPNLWHALRRLRLSKRSRAIWVDAICIDQNDDRERGHQVSLMGKIYKHAGGVLIWLGIDPDNYSERVFKSICRYVNTWRPDEAEDDRATFSISENFPVCPSTKPAEDPRSWNPTMNLYMNPWFKRVWVIQEASLSSSATVIWGRCEIAWRWIGMAVTDHDLDLLLGYEADVGIRNAKLIYNLSRSRPGSYNWTQRSFYELLVMTRRFEASDPRDKIYGLLGLSTKDNDPENGNKFIEPDYTLSYETLLKKAAIKIKDSTDTLELLSSVQHPPNTDFTASNILSWVPQWDTEFSTVLPSDRNFNASKNFPKIRNNSIKIDELCATAVPISHISKIFPFISKLGSIGQRQDLRSFIHSDDHLSLLCRTLMAGKRTHTSRYKVTRGCEVEEVCESIYNIPREAHLKMLQLINMQPQPSPPPGRDPELRDSLADWFVHCIGRRLFVTENGFLGLGPAVMEVGDLVCILEGVKVPIVLRNRQEFRIREEFSVVGEAYVEGFMEGEGEGVDAILKGSAIQGPLKIPSKPAFAS